MQTLPTAKSSVVVYLMNSFLEILQVEENKLS